MLSGTNSVFHHFPWPGAGADDPDLSVAHIRSMATLHNHNLLYIIHGNGYFSQTVGDASFPLWALLDAAFSAILAIAELV